MPSDAPSQPSLRDLCHSDFVPALKRRAIFHDVPPGQTVFLKVRRAVGEPSKAGSTRSARRDGLAQQIYGPNAAGRARRRSVNPRRVSSSAGSHSVSPGRGEGGVLGRCGMEPGVKPGQLNRGTDHLSAGGDFKVAVARETSLVPPPFGRAPPSARSRHIHSRVRRWRSWGNSFVS